MGSPQSQLTLKNLTAHRAPTAGCRPHWLRMSGPKSSTSRVEVSISVPRKVLEEEPMELVSSMKQFPGVASRILFGSERAEFLAIRPNQVSQLTNALRYLLYWGAAESYDQALGDRFAKVAS
jgi:hypothetical protein